MHPIKGQTDLDIDHILNQAWGARQANFNNTVVFSTPGKTVSVSVTGPGCALNCAHCAGVYLRSMVPLDKALADSRDLNRKETSYLISGGSDTRGRVPLLQNLQELKELAKQGPLNLHTGLVGEEEARQLGDIAEVVSFDLVGDNETIADVYGLSATVEDYFASYRILQKYTRVVPHLCIGLNGGMIRGEYETLHLLRQEKVEAISMIIFRPTAETPFSGCRPPSPAEVVHLMASARLMFPHTPIYLGCMRPGGRYREIVDVYALKAGVNKIVLPAPEARREAVRMGLSVKISEECCSL